MAGMSLQRGMWIRHQGHVYEVTDFHERHTGKQKPTVHVQLRDVRDGRPVDRTLYDIEPIEPVEHGRRMMQFLYATPDALVFMDSETFDEHELRRDQTAGRDAFLADGAQYIVTMLEGRPATVVVPDIVTLKVTITAAPSHAVGTSANITKEATLDNGLEIRVPLFIKSGDVIRVDTRDRSYAGKDHADGA